MTDFVFDIVPSTSGPEGSARYRYIYEQIPIDLETDLMIFLVDILNPNVLTVLELEIDGRNAIGFIRSAELDSTGPAGFVVSVAIGIEGVEELSSGNTTFFVNTTTSKKLLGNLLRVIRHNARVVSNAQDIQLSNSAKLTIIQPM